MDGEENGEWVEEVCAELEIKPVLPLWGVGAEEILADFQGLGFKAVVVANRLEKSLLGKSLDKAFLDEIRKFNCYPCGEFGEYHTFVTSGPVFRKSLKVAQGKRERRDDVWFLEISAELEQYRLH